MGDEALPRVLVAEADAATAAGIVRGLRAEGFDVELATDGTEAARRIVTEPYDAIVLELTLPGRDGFEVLERVRHRARAPIFVLSARAELPDRLRAFELGAADFVSKPFWIEELAARIRSRLRLDHERPKRITEWSGVEVDLDAHTAEANGELLSLTPTEFAILAFLVERPGRAVSRSVLATHALASLDAPDARTVDSHVARLRKKLGAGAAAIRTVWGIGYRFRIGPDEADDAPGPDEDDEPDA
jgi:two-component system OmpR family response regulator